MNVLIACEESQEVCKAFRARGHNAFSCDLQEPSGGHPEWHILGDVMKVINVVDDGELEAICFSTMDNEIHVIEKWDLLIAHPPCTYLTTTGNRWFNVDLYGDKAKERARLREEAAEFFMRFVDADCDRIAIENPIGYMSSKYRKPDQYIQPFQFGDAFEKKTALWLKNLPLLKHTNVVEPPKRICFDSGKTMPAWYAEAWNYGPKVRARIRAKTFPGIAAAMADQWGGGLCHDNRNY